MEKGTGDFCRGGGLHWCWFICMFLSGLKTVIRCKIIKHLSKSNHITNKMSTDALSPGVMRATVLILNICTAALQHDCVVWIDFLLLAWVASSHLTLSRLQLQFQKTQYLQLGPNRGQYYGGSLPNVNQIGNATVDMTFQVRRVWHLPLLCSTLQDCDIYFLVCDIEGGESGVASLLKCWEFIPFFPERLKAPTAQPQSSFFRSKWN